MRSAYSWLLRSFLAAFVILITVQVLILGAGIVPVLDSYSRNQIRYLDDLAKRILINPSQISPDTPQHWGPFFVFSADRELIYSNRGRGRTIPESDYRLVHYDDMVIGYYYAGEVRFLDSRSNRHFLGSLGILTAASMLASLGIAVLASVRTARGIAGPVAVLRRDIQELRALKAPRVRVFPVNELSEISSSLNRVGTILEGEEEYKQQWMQNIAHDLRTPLSGLKGQLEGMRDGVLEAGTERFNRTLQEIDRLETMIASVCELSRIENLKSLTVEAVSSEDFLKAVHSTFEPCLAERGCTLSCSAQTPFFYADRELMQRAVENIVGNAFTYAGPGALIDMKITSGTRDATILTISNSGPHIPEEQLDKIFQRFYRGEYSRSTPGSGLGLNISREIVQRHGGCISAENLSPEGVVFTITLPQQQIR
ncbi:HAMP domain-containing sensor histidine kinase [Marispirochaeta sp.]|jgi:two-component system, OmpR family, sensor histidine kinase BaeS|uniref:sensor histidine kinase n=1 Tax=Marispirochaeta sp. TaxID=2038653 RepID=UPI0029C6FAC8|nr:HAMP domain-containing sensor histidine kinase [Marispirochaeta sp.]